ncbi:MAG TPA: prepilin-type N-terminal cleavage/methylation domain-containing protein [Gemmatimonadaceae bacterium]|nr:prepilin-type N-terminal cleavage/methylation domain-containing protein [Gemmatimonadaceae bacterium]
MSAPRRDGFTLISVIIAITLLSVGVMALAGAQFTAVRQTRLELQRTQAIQLVSAYAEEIRSRNPWTLTNEGPVSVDSTGAVNPAGRYTRRVVVTDEGTQLLRAVITVQPRNAKVVRIETLIFKSGQ